MCQLELDVKVYTFLDGNSYLDCSYIYDGLEYQELANHLAANNDFKGMLREDELVELIQLVQAARTIPQYDKDLIMKSFE
ncbi:MAG: hypothetical protein KIT46_03650 [Anaerolineales bacterium]|nr:hypothetical protein [Anaerolineales bacterium]MCW5855120.1 hypothetical protein [Anaerolineales bacterium]